MPADAPARCVIKPPAVTVLTSWDNCALHFHKEAFQRHPPSQRRDIMENANGVMQFLPEQFMASKVNFHIVHSTNQWRRNSTFSTTFMRMNYINTTKL